MRPITSVFCLLTSVLCSSCIHSHPTSPSATEIPEAHADPQHWLSQPGTASVSNPNLQLLWNTTEATAQSYFFTIDRRNLRGGQLTTNPLISKQFFEPWRKDAVTSDDVWEASLGNIRRTVHFQFTKADDGTHTVTPKVLVERESRIDRNDRDPDEDPRLPTTYWYALRRDAALEKQLADSIRDRLTAPQ